MSEGGVNAHARGEKRGQTELHDCPGQQRSDGHRQIRPPVIYTVAARNVEKMESRNRAVREASNDGIRMVC